MFQNDRFVHLFKWNGAEEVLTIRYPSYRDGEWEGLIWPGGSTQVRDCINSFPHGQNGRHFTYDVLKSFFVIETFCILI